MTEPLEYQILKDLQTALAAISIAGGYYHDIAGGVAVKLDADSKVEDLIARAGPEVAETGPRPFIILEVAAENFGYFPAEQIRLVMPFVVHFVNDTDPKEDDDLMRSFFRLAADVEKAVNVDHTRGGLATDTRIVGREKRSYEGALIWAQISGEVLENRTYGQP